MRAAVRAAFLPFMDRWEGDVRTMYLDKDGSVTVGHGNLLPLALAMRLDWTRIVDGAPASGIEIRGEWTRVSSLQHMKGAGGGRFVAGARLRIVDDSLAHLVEDELASFERLLRQPGWFPGYDDAPSDGQLPLLRMTWALGPYKLLEEFPKFRGLYVAGEFAAAAEEARMKEDGQPREFVQANDAVQMLLRNASLVVSRGLDPDFLYWPRCLEQPTDTDPAPSSAPASAT